MSATDGVSCDKAKEFKRKWLMPDEIVDVRESCKISEFFENP